MASKKEKLRILAGSLNLLPPSDKIPDGDAVLLDNWRVDQQGELRSRNGSNHEAGPVGSGYFHTLNRFGLTDRYSGVGADLWWGPSMQVRMATGFDGNPLGMAFFRGAAWVMNRNQQLRISPGGQTGNVTGVTPWGVPAPAKAPVASAGAQLFTKIEDWDGTAGAPLAAGLDVGYFTGGQFIDSPTVFSVSTSQGTVTFTVGSTSISVTGSGTNWTNALVGQLIEINTTYLGNPFTFGTVVTSVLSATQITAQLSSSTGDPGSGLSYQIGVEVPAAAYDVTHVQSGSSSLGVNASSPAQGAQWVITDNLVQETGFTVDTRTLGVAQDADQFRMWIYCTNPAAITSITVALFSGTSDAAAVAAGTIAYVTIPGSALNQLPNSWSQILISRNVNIDDLNGQYSSLTTFTDAQGDTTDPAAANLISQLTSLLQMPHFTESNNGVSYTAVSSAGPAVGADGFILGPILASGASIYGSQNTVPCNIDWSAISAIQLLINTNAPCSFSVDHAQFEGSAGVPLTGSGSYFVSFANTWGEDGDLSPEADISVNNQSIILTQIPVSPDPQVTQRWIWRVGFGSSLVFLVGTISDNIATSWVDDTSVTDAQNEGVQAPSGPTARDLPPACRGVIGPYFGKLIAFNSDAFPARYWWNNSGQPWYFPGSGDTNDGNWEDAGDDSDGIVQCTNHAAVLMFYKQRSIQRLQGDPATSDPVQVTANIGLVGPNAVCNAGSCDYFVGPEGVYMHNFFQEQKISQQLDPLFKGDYVEVSAGVYLPPIDPQGIANSCLTLINDRLRFCYPEQGQQYPNVVAIAHIDAAALGTSGASVRWAREKYTVPGATAPTVLHYEGAGLLLMAGFTTTGGGYLYSLENGQSDAGSDINVSWQSRYSDQGLPDNEKRYSDIIIDFQTGFGLQTPSTLTVSLVLDNGATTVVLGAISSSTRTTVSFLELVADQQELQAALNYGVRGKNVAILITGAVNSTCIIYSVYVHWYPEERIATGFDSGFMTKEKVSQLDYIELYTTGSGQTANAIFLSDLPGNQLGQNLNASFVIPAGRGTVKERLPRLIEGRAHRLTIAASPFQLHAGRLRHREIGEYIDGTLPTPEYWESPEFSVAPGRAGELKDLLLDYDTINIVTGSPYPGNPQLVLYADLPGNALTVVRQIVFPSSVRRTFTFPFEGNFVDGFQSSPSPVDPLNDLPLGTLFKVRLYPPPHGVLRLHDRGVIRARLIGVYFDGSMGEIWETQPLSLVDGIGEFREVHIVAEAAGPMTFNFQTTLPGRNMATAASYTFTTTTNTTGREPIRFRVPGNTKGWLQRFQVIGPYVCRIFDVQVYGRRVGGGATPFSWLKVPMERTPDEWTPIQLPMNKTAEGFTWIDLPVDSIE